MKLILRYRKFSGITLLIPQIHSITKMKVMLSHLNFVNVPKQRHYDRSIIWCNVLKVEPGCTSQVYIHAVMDISLLKSNAIITKSS